MSVDVEERYSVWIESRIDGAALGATELSEVGLAVVGDCDGALTLRAYRRRSFLFPESMMIGFTPLARTLTVLIELKRALYPNPSR